ncbi:transposase [Brucella sp. BE17]|uniref:transposase n=1 Tax=Brucella sp. BE17 TaxID=3142977 RepID=UPI0031BA36AF
MPPSTASSTLYPLDRKAYLRRNVIERLFCKLKNRRRIANRYDRLAVNYLSAIVLISAVIAWSRMSPYPNDVSMALPQ